MYYIVPCERSEKENQVRLNNWWGRENKMDWKLFKSLDSIMMPACGIVGGTMYITDAKEAFWVMEVNATAKSVQRLSKLLSAGTLHRPADLQPIEC